MNAPSQSASTQSHIGITFGTKIGHEKTPIDMNLTFDIFSQKHQNIRFNLKQMLGINITDDTLLLELVAKKGYGSQLADKIMTFLKGNEHYLKLHKENKVQVKAVGKGDTCYLFVNSPELTQTFEAIAKECSEFYKQQEEQPNANNAIKLQVKSLNNCQQLRKLLDNQGGMRAAFDSLSLDFTFQKTKVVEKILQKVFQSMQLPTIIGPLKSFNNLNLNVNFASSADLDRYESLRVFAKVANKLNTSFFTHIKGEFKDEVKFIYFNPVVSLSGKVIAENVEVLLEGLFEGSKNDS